MNPALHAFIKFGTGIFIVPLTFGLSIAWPWWENASIFKKVITAPFILPAAGFLYLVCPWWNDL